MPGTHVYTDKVAADVVRLMKNKLGCTYYFNRKYERDFNEGQPIGDTLRVKKPNRGTVVDGFGYTGANIERQYTTVVADQMFHIPCDWDTIEKAIQMERSDEDIQKNILDPLAAQLAQECDTRAMRFARLNTPWTVGALGATPTAMSTYLQAKTIIEELGGWHGSKRRAMFVSPDMMSTVAAGTPNIMGQFHPRNEAEMAFREGSIGHFGGFDWFTSMSWQRHTSGIITTQASVTMNGANQTGTSLNLNCTTGDTFIAGDYISIANVNAVNNMSRQSTGRAKRFKIMANATGAASAVTLTVSPGIVGPGSPYQNVNALNTNTAAVTFLPGTTVTDGSAVSGLFGLGITSDAFALVAIDLPMPKKDSEQYVGKYTDPETGITIGIIKHFDFESRSWKTRMDCWIGFGNLQAEFAAILIGSAN